MLEFPGVLAVLLAPRPDVVPLIPRLFEGLLANALATYTIPHGDLFALPARGKAHPPLIGLAFVLAAALAGSFLTGIPLDHE